MSLRKFDNQLGWQIWKEVKLLDPDAVVLLESGDGYLTFDKDAIAVAALMEIEAGEWNQHWLCPVPNTQVERLFNILASKKIPVAICTQLN
jgi:DNA mismatch repair ATPase MutS